MITMTLGVHSPQRDMRYARASSHCIRHCDAVVTVGQALQSERASLQAQLAAVHPAVAQRLRSEVAMLRERLGQLSDAEARLS